MPSLDLPLTLALAPPRPNPAQGTARIAFELPHRTNLLLRVHDPAGRTVRQLFRGAHDSGRFELIWDLRNDNGQSVPSGVYFVQLAAGGSKLSRRMIALP